LREVPHDLGARESNTAIESDCLQATCFDAGEKRRALKPDQTTRLRDREQRLNIVILHLAVPLVLNAAEPEKWRFSAGSFVVGPGGGFNALLLPDR
jgi:hypothetical protein